MALNFSDWFRIDTNFPPSVYLMSNRIRYRQWKFGKKQIVSGTETTKLKKLKCLRIKKNKKHVFCYLYLKTPLSGVPLSSKQTPSVQHISSTFGPHLFSHKNPSVSHRKPFSSNPLSSTPITPQFHAKNAYIELVELRGGTVWKILNLIKF